MVVGSKLVSNCKLCKPCETTSVIMGHELCNHANHCPLTHVKFCVWVFNFLLRRGDHSDLSYPMNASHKHVPIKSSGFNDNIHQNEDLKCLEADNKFLHQLIYAFSQDVNREKITLKINKNISNQDK